MTSWGPDPTPDTHRERHLPGDTDWERGEIRWLWPSHHVGYQVDDLFTTLHAEFNTINIAIQDPLSWFSDVRELARQCDSKAEFDTALRQRRESRYRELYQAWDKIVFEHIFRHPERRKRDDYSLIRDALIDLNMHFSFDSIVGYFASWLDNEDNSSNVPQTEQLGIDLPPLSPDQPSLPADLPPITPDLRPPSCNIQDTWDSAQKRARRVKGSKPSSGCIKKQNSKHNKLQPRQGIRKSLRLQEKAAKKKESMKIK
ncbi:hypothetical protein F5Y17DRAFT_226387 [Xylariaceae sp. FL0594]|nr:hypothetical protein F5Y17DRAFT_226387 [Xylariaceae sp. FL0594]